MKKVWVSTERVADLPPIGKFVLIITNIKTNDMPAIMRIGHLGTREKWVNAGTPVWGDMGGGSISGEQVAYWKDLPSGPDDPTIKLLENLEDY